MTPQDIQERLIALVDVASVVEVETELNKIVADAKEDGTPCKLGWLKSDLKRIRDNLSKIAVESQRSELGLAIERMNDEYFVSVSSSKVRIGRLSAQTLNGHSYLDHQEFTKEDFRILFQNNAIAGKSIADWWLESPDRRVIAGSFMCEKHPPNAIINGRLNLWQGFGVEPAPGDWKWFADHIRRLLRHDAQAIGYVLRWLAWCVQHPCQPIGTMVMLIGEQGAGKGAIGNVMRSIFGPHGIVVENREQIVGKFNSGMRDACFVFVDEALFAGSKADADRLKHLITEPTITVERKFRDPEEVDNRLKLFAVTNHEHAVAMDPGDRRHAVFECALPADVGDDEYWRRYWERANNPACKAAVLDMLLSLNLAGWSPGRDRPSTTVGRLQKLQSLSADMLWWRLVLEGETWMQGRGPAANAKLSEPWVAKTIVHMQYVDWHQMSGKPGNPTNATHFWRNFRKWASEDLFLEKKDHGKPREINLGSFSAMLEIFEKWIGK